LARSPTLAGVDAMKRIWNSPLGAAVIGGLVVGLLGGIAIAAGWIDSNDDSDGVPLAQAPLVKPGANSSNGSGLTVHDIYQRTAPGVAFIQSQVAQQPSAANPFGGGRGTATGSGFVIDEQGHILTNAHVVDGAEQISVKLGDNQPTVDGKVVGRDPSSDLALVQVDPDQVDLHPLPLDDSSDTQVGDPVVAIGNPFGLDRTATAGIVSALQREIDAPNGFTISDVIQTDAPINPGNSGGPLIDAAGKVIGVNSQIATAGGGGGSVGIGFAVPSNTANDVVEQLLATGKVQHAFLGVTGADVDSEVADVLNLDVQQGALVQQVVPGGPADKAGIKGGKAEVSVGGRRIAAGGDVITAVDGKTVSGMDDVVSAVNAKAPGDEIQLSLVHGSDRRDVTVTLAQRPQHASGGSSPAGPPGLP
jgi:S1-C subfamily serine protease